MKVNATKSTPLGGAFWDGGAQNFIHKGTNGRWRETLSAQEVAKYERRAALELDSECAQWLATGEIVIEMERVSNVSQSKMQTAGSRAP